MTPTISIHSDDAQKAVAVLEDIWKVLRHFRVGLFARDHGRLCVAISEPSGAQMFVGGVHHSRQTTPSERKLVKQWTDQILYEMLPNAAEGEVPYRAPSLTRDDVADGIGQVMRHFGCGIIPAPVGGEPVMLLCDRQPDGRWRAFAVIGELDAYGFTWRPVKEQVKQ